MVQIILYRLLGTAQSNYSAINNEDYPKILKNDTLGNILVAIIII